jgi:hypothetical protein
MELNFDEGSRIETRSIVTPKGEELTVQMSPAFVSLLKKHFGLNEVDELNDDHVRMFLWGALNSAIEKEERKTDVEGHAA